MIKSLVKPIPIRLAGVAIALLLLAACAAQAPQAAPEAEPENTYSFEPWDGDGMDIPLDGSSLEAFETSLARVKAHTSAKNYTTLLNAIDYHLMYDLGAKRDKAKLASRLDGMTPNEVIAKVDWGPSTTRGRTPGHGATGTTIDL